MGVAGLAATPGRASSQGLTVERLARWLLVAVVLDLIVTRLVVRLAMFVPKEEPWATMARALGRLGAATDALVPIVGVLLLGALSLRAARSGGTAERVTVVAVCLAATGGFALVVVPPTPGVLLAIDLVVGVAAIGAALGVARLPLGSVLVRSGLVALATALALTAGARALAVIEAIGWPIPSGWGAATGAVIDVWAQLAFVTGAVLVGLAGVLEGRTSRSPSRTRAALAVGVTMVLLAAWLRAPASWDSVAIWGFGLSGAVPSALVAVVVGLLLAGLPPLHRRMPMVAVGASTVLAAGIGLAASGLVLAGLLGLLVAASEDDVRPVGPDGTTRPRVSPT